MAAKSIHESFAISQAKTCSKCGRTLFLYGFHRDKRSKDGHKSVCRECSSKYNKEVAIPRHKVHPHIPLLKKEIAKIKTDHGCTICGYNKIAQALDFHHVKGKKSGAISTLIGNGVKHLIRPEICKCVVLCKNCHTEVHTGMHDILSLREHTVKLGDIGDASRFNRRTKALKLIKSA